MIVPLYARTFTFALGYLQFPLHRGCQTLESAAWGKRASLLVLLNQPQSRGLITSAGAAYRFKLTSQDASPRIHMRAEWYTPVHTRHRLRHPNA